MGALESERARACSEADKGVMWSTESRKDRGWRMEEDRTGIEYSGVQRLLGENCEWPAGRLIDDD